MEAPLLTTEELLARAIRGVISDRFTRSPRPSAKVLATLLRRTFPSVSTALRSRVLVALADDREAVVSGTSDALTRIRGQGEATLLRDAARLTRKGR